MSVLQNQKSNPDTTSGSIGKVAAILAVLVADVEFKFDTQKAVDRRIRFAQGFRLNVETVAVSLVRPKLRISNSLLVRLFHGSQNQINLLVT